MRPVLLACCILLTPLLQAQWSHVQELTAPDGIPGDNLGDSLSASEVWLAVGSLNNDQQGINSGAVYVFRRTPGLGTWFFDQKILSADGSPGDKFGSSVSLSGEVLAVGAHEEDALGNGSGSAYVFRYDSDLEVWFEEQKLVATDGAQQDLLGESISASGDLVLVGARGSGPGTGAAYLFREQLATSTWLEE